MLVRLQFVVSIPYVEGGGFRAGTDNTALAWPLEGKSGRLYLTHEPLASIGYGSETVAIADLDRWLSTFPNIIEAETVVLGEQS